MNGSRHEAVTHVLALIAVAVILILAAAVVASSVSKPSRNSQTAATLVTAIEESEQLTDNPGFATASCSAQGTITIINYACNQKAKVSDIKLLEQTCRPGFKYVVNEVKGEIFVYPEVLVGGPSLAGCTVPAPPKCKTEGIAKQSTNGSTCQVEYCVGVDIANNGKTGCFSSEGNPSESIGDLADKMRGSAMGDLLADLSPEEVEPALQQLGVSREDAIVKSAFNQAETTIQEQITKNEDAIRAIKEYAEGCGLVTCEATASELAAKREEQSRLEQENKTLGEQMSKLADAEKRLAPTPPVSPTSPPPEPCVIVSVQPLKLTGDCGNLISGNDTFGDPFGGGLPGGGLPGGAGGIGQLLQGLMKGLQGGQQGQGGAPPPGNQNPQTPGTCAPQLVCTNNTLYSRNSQCVDVPMQQCPHGCTGNACNQPPGAPTAQLSCQPQVADPGMTVAITWGCSAGVSTASGFSTGGALSGATSRVVTAPSGSTNTVAFGLVCSNQSLSSSASCTVQVTKPAIVLVANPDSVPLNDKATIGWVTSGMEKCTVSSPDQLDFTERNASRTNINGVAETSPVTETTDILLTCTTLGGNVREATSTITVLGEEGSE